MKKIFVLTLIAIPNLVISQDVFSFPEELLIDPYAYVLQELNFQRIEQYHSTSYDESEDSTCVIDYIVEYDSLRQVSSFKYNFKKEYGHSIMSSPTGQVNIYAYNDTNRLQFVATASDTIYYNYYENEFIYGAFNQLESIQIIRPYRGGIIDGVYIRGAEKNKLIIEKIYDGNRLMEVVSSQNGDVIYRSSYKYISVILGTANTRFCMKLYVDIQT